jgi:hypothetical protein
MAAGRFRKLVVRLLLGVVLLLTLSALLLLYLVKRDPDWFKEIALTTQQVDTHSKSLEDKMTVLANEVDQTSVGVSSAPQLLKLSITEDELNAMYAKWSKWNNTAEFITKKVSDPQIRLRDGELIAAGRLQGFSTVLSVHFAAVKDDAGTIRFRMNGMRSGALPLPEASIAGQKESLIRTVDSEVSRMRPEIVLDPPNKQAMQVLAGSAIVQLFRGKEVDGLVLLKRGGLPVDLTAVARLIDIQIDDGKADLTFRLASPDEVKKLEADLKRGY